MKKLLFTLFVLFSINSNAQKKVLDHPDFDIWNSIQRSSISANGDFIIYSIVKGEKDSQLKIKNNKGDLVFEYNRSENNRFTYDSKFVVFNIKAWKDTIVEMKRRKVKKDKMPKDTLGIYNLDNDTFQKIANIKSYKIPEKWSGFLAYDYDLKAKKSKDSIKSKDKKKKPSAINGYPLVIRNLDTSEEDTIPFVTNYIFSKKSKTLAYTTTGFDEKQKPGVYVIDLKNNKTKLVFESHKKTKYFKLNLSDSGKNLGFIVDSDSTKIQQRPYELYSWNTKDDNAKLILNKEKSPKGYQVSSNGSITFSKDDNKLYFGLALPEIIQDTLLLDEEIVNVEVWTYDEPRLYTVQEKQLKNDKNKSFKAVYHLKENKTIQIETEEFPNSILSDEGNGNYALISNRKPYQLSSQWTGKFSANDLAVLNIENGNSKMAIKALPSPARFSPKGIYAYGYNEIDSTWFTYNVKTEKYTELTKGKKFYNELNDTPNHPRSYGSAGWTKNDKRILIYDRYDIWEFDPENISYKKLTDGRKSKTRFRVVNLDSEKKFIDSNQKILMVTYNEISKNSGYYEYNYKAKSGTQLLDGPYSLSYPKKARLNDKLIYTRQSFTEYPNIRVSDLSFNSNVVISDANPQQKDYNWGTAELVNWSSLDGIDLTGMLIKPENFDPNKKYPMIVNFYERSSNALHSHRAPNPGRSSINYSFYTSRGYLIFNPDVHYRVGYPGESAFNCVIPGVTSLIEKGFVDEKNIGVQGHSWGGYQIAYLVTKTNIFKAAESGAPVVNMISAFGGIRWDTGLSRQFQYEHTQSRIGGTPWEYPQRYFENSPIYNIDKINTPLLIMHNDADGHVPWYQGIEFFVSLRRLGKPSWLLNYNGARHWPLKMQNRKDFNIRMQQFFDHYLMGAPKPMWMVRGVPAIEKGINQGYELSK
ncbi:MAG: S9 family peptidase [Pelagibacteraceae bacterium TMED267]|nr:MAG: S9 family peptidase [Pelagibacteraceae bacterium TMED267]